MSEVPLQYGEVDSYTALAFWSSVSHDCTTLSRVDDRLIALTKTKHFAYTTKICALEMKGTTRGNDKSNGLAMG